MLFLSKINVRCCFLFARATLCRAYRVVDARRIIGDCWRIVDIEDAQIGEYKQMLAMSLMNENVWLAKTQL